MDDCRERSVESLRARATGADAVSREVCDLGALFAELADGISRIADEFLSRERCYLVFVRRDPRMRQLPLPQRAVLERALSARGGQKVVAQDLGRSVSAVSLMLKSALRFMGLSCGASRVPLLLVVAAQARLGHEKGWSARCSSFPVAGVTHLVVSVRRPDEALAPHLPMAEYGVVRLLVEGKTREEIARLRGTSERTVANQLRSVFRRLEVSGRLELLHYLASLKAPPSSPTRRPSSLSLNRSPQVFL